MRQRHRYMERGEWHIKTQENQREGSHEAIEAEIGVTVAAEEH